MPTFALVIRAGRAHILVMPAMAGDEVKRSKTQRRRHGDTDTAKSRKRSDDDKVKNPVATADHPADIDALREARLSYLAKDPEERRKEMKYEYVKRTKTVSHVGGERDRRPKVPREESTERESRDPERRPTKHNETGRRQTLRDRSEDGYVYSKAERSRAPRPAPAATPIKEKTKTQQASPRKPEERRQPVERRHTEHGARKTVYTFDEEPEISPAKANQRPELKRSATTTKARTEVSVAKAPEATSKRTSTLFGGLLPAKPVPQKKVSCLTCGDDDIPIARSALLPCKHRMCNTCLRRIFNMSVTDPAHMPPRCCTDQHIDLKHVEKLFDDKFKVLWNRKFQEYKTKNRIYCPGRKCGAWIKPHYITMENGRKVGRCKQCKIRVCTICSQKMHTTRECPKDPETKALIETAKEKGWQRCYDCHAIVELKEGCNHMTCRCMAEFCMVCGCKWKTCDCPWFNYAAVDAHNGDPVRMQQELDRRREQVNLDEELARRMQRLGGDQNFIQQAREALTANYAQANRAARDLLNGFGMGRENPPAEMGVGEMLDAIMERRRGGRDPAENQDEARRLRRRGTGRRRTPNQDDPAGHGAGMASDEERRMQDWANAVT